MNAYYCRVNNTSVMSYATALNYRQSYKFAEQEATVKCRLQKRKI